MKERIPALFLALVVVALLAPAASARPAPLTKVTCGQVITQSIRVANDLHGCDYGLIVDAPNVRIDLNRHTFTGTGEFNGAGVTASHVDGVTVRNGTVRNFFIGVRFDVSGGNVIERMRAIDNAHGYLVTESTRTQLVDSSATGGHNGASIGLLAHGSRVSRFRASRNAAAGIAVSVLSTGNLVERSEVDGSDIGIQINEADGNTVTRNRVSDSRFGILVEISSHSNRVVGNDVTRSDETGIWVNDASDNVIRDNRVTRSGGDGILVTEPASGNVLTGNGTFSNGLLGINAASGAVDGGGNRARGNGDPRQCVGVACRR